VGAGVLGRRRRDLGDELGHELHAPRVTGDQVPPRSTSTHSARRRRRRYQPFKT
jgi:hypothetical protein